jgi:aryl-alcohol dehydrogenase-like predicted oxidoreductase
VRRRRVGDSGLEVSQIGLGTMTWGAGTDIDDATEQTAESYGAGTAQQVLGEVLATAVRREDVVLAGRGGVPGGPLGDGTARGALLAGLDAVLDRLGTDHLDLWQLPGFDARVPLEETLSAVQVAVYSGRARYAGLVGPSGWQLATVAERGRALGGVTTPVSAQVEYSLLCRDPEPELLPAALHHGVGVFAWAPLGRGVLTGKYVDGTPADSRGASPELAPYVEARRNGRSARIVHAVLTAADGLGTSPLSVALAWVRDQPGVGAAIVGARDAAQLTASMAADPLVLPAEIRAALDDVSDPD